MTRLDLLLCASMVAGLPSSALAQQDARVLKDIAESASGQLEANTAEEVSPGTYRYASSFELLATVVSVDMETRAVELRGPKGNSLTIVAGPAVRNLAQVKAGDDVVIEYEESAEIALIKSGSELRGGADAMVSKVAQPGERPAAALVKETDTIVKVVALDRTNQIVTLQGPDRHYELPVQDPDQFALIEIGDSAAIALRAQIAARVEPAEQKP